MEAKDKTNIETETRAEGKIVRRETGHLGRDNDRS